MARLDSVTSELPGVPPVPRRRGRPATGTALTAAERQAAYRARKAEAGRKETAVSLSVEVLDALKAHVAKKNADTAVEPESVGDAVDRIVRAYLLRKR